MPAAVPSRGPRPSSRRRHPARGGPDRVFRSTLRAAVANIGAVVVSHAAGVRVTPRLVRDGDENRLTGYAALPVNINPYSDFGRVEPVVGAILPAPGVYDFVFDTPPQAKPGKFTFHMWVDDTTPPAVRLLAGRARTIRLAVTD